MHTQALQAEILTPVTGRYAGEYYKWLGFRDFTASDLMDGQLAPARAAAVRSLLSAHEPFIYKHDVIVGSLRPLWADISEADAVEAHRVCAGIGDRHFGTNADHYAPDYRTFLRDGIPGTAARLAASRLAHAGEEKKIQFLDAMGTALSGLSSMIAHYADKALSLKGTAGYDDAVLDGIAARCHALTERAPESFAEALQLMWFCHLSFCFEGRYAMALGRIDQFLYPYFRKDVESGALTEEEATALLENVFAKIYERHSFTGGDDVVNICIGGMNKAHECEINRLSYCVLHAVDRVHQPGPNLSCRVTPDTPDDFLDECLQVIGTGLGYPALMNDEVNLAALARYGYDEDDLYDYCMVGCIENLIAGAQRPWSDGRFDTPRFFEYLFNEGKGIMTKSEGVNTGRVSDIRSMEELVEKFEIQLRKGVADYVNGFRAMNDSPDPERFTSPFLSLFCRDCIGRGMDINAGGARYPSVHGAALMGVGTVCDSLAAIEQTVFVDHSATLDEIREAMLCNFEGKEALRELLLAAPKYGNNHPLPDKYAVWFVDFLASAFDQYRTQDGGGIYVAMAANVSNIWAGTTISATPDGRLAGEPVSDAASPTYGRDTHGVTSTFNSVTKPDYTRVACGTVVNQKFSPAMFTDEKRARLLALIKVYFKKGGQELQINATSREVLRDAMIHPEKYPTMVVRVSGFSAIYVTLDPRVQEDILNRTQQDE